MDTVSEVNSRYGVFIGSSRWIFRHMLLESGQFFAVLVVEPLHLEM